MFRFPCQSSDLQKIEQLQKTFTKKTPSIRHLNYWERLRILKMYSQQRRLERYRILYTWKILEGLVPNFGLVSKFSERRGREVHIPPLKGAQSVKKLFEQSFQVNGPSLLNYIPRKITDLAKVYIYEFKEHLDKYLQVIPF